MTDTQQKKRIFTVRLMRCDKNPNDDNDWEWKTISKEQLNIVETLRYLEKIYSMHENAEPDGYTIESVIWEDDDGTSWSVMIDG